MGRALLRARSGRVCVRWVRADFETCVDPGDLRSLGSDAHLLTIKRRDKNGHAKVLKHTVIAGVGLQDNWVVEFLPRNVVRAMRTDGSAWTFEINPIFRRINTWWRQPPDDDDAEALVAAETALRQRN